MAVTVEHVSPGFTFCVSVPDSEPPSLPSLMENVTVTPSASELDELELLDAACGLKVSSGVAVCVGMVVSAGRRSSVS